MSKNKKVKHVNLKSGKNIRIRLKAYDYRLLDRSALEIVSAAKKTGVEVVGPIPLPTKTSYYTVLRSPFIDKKSREQFVVKIHKRVVIIVSPTSDTLNSLMKLDLAAGVDVQLRD